VKLEKEHYIKVWSDVCDENQGLLNEIEQLRQRLHEVSVDWQCGQAREAKLRAALHKYRDSVLFRIGTGSPYRNVAQEYFDFIKPILALPTDDTALKEAIKQAKREALLEAAECFDDWDTRVRLKRLAEGDENA